MKKEKRRTVVISDYHPAEIPGPGTEALNCAKHLALSPHFSVTFMSSGLVDRTYCDFSMTVTEICRNKLQMKLFKRSDRLKVVKLAKFALRQLITIRLFVKLIKYRKAEFVVHKVGDVFSRSIILFLVFMGKKPILIHHDFSYLGNKKLVPESLCETAILRSSSEIVGSGISLAMRKISRRAKVFRRILNSTTKQIALSELQAAIFNANGFNILKNIPQSVDLCSCSISSMEKKEQSQIRIAFIGRGIGKGFEELVALAKTSTKIHLRVAGPNYLLDWMKTQLPISRYSFFGAVPYKSIPEVLHACDLVWARSQCFDVGPLTILESLAHGVPVVCTPLTGNSTFARLTLPSLVQPSDWKITEDYLQQVLIDWNEKKCFTIAKHLLSSLVRDSYSEILDL